VDILGPDSEYRSAGAAAAPEQVTEQEPAVGQAEELGMPTREIYHILVLPVHQRDKLEELRDLVSLLDLLEYQLPGSKFAEEPDLSLDGAAIPRPVLRHISLECARQLDLVRVADPAPWIN